MTYTLSGLEAIQSIKWSSVGYLPDEGTTRDPSVEALKCPHCNRDWHTAPLTRRVATMVRNHRFDPTYRAAEDDSPIECVGSDTCGPNRDLGWRPSWDTAAYTLLFPAGWNDAFKKAQASLAKMAESKLLTAWPKWSVQSAPWVTFYDEAYQPITPPCPPDLEVDVKFGPEHWPIERAKAPFSVRHFVSKVHADEWREPIPAPASPGLDVSTLVEQFNKKHNWNGVDK